MKVVNARNAAAASAKRAQEDDDVSSVLSNDRTVDVEAHEKIKKLEEDNRKMAAENLILKSGRQNKRAKKDQSKQFVDQIKAVVKDHLWRTTKFLTSQAQQDAFIQKVWDNLDYSDDVRKALNEYKWKMQYGTVCLTKLNDQRTYAIGRIRKEALRKIAQDGPNNLPTYNQIYACALRNVQAGPAKNIYPWYTHVLLNAACGNRSDWNKHLRCFHGPSECHFPDNVNKLYIPASTEAFLCITWDSCRDVWIEQFHFLQDPENKGKKVPVPRAKNGQELTAEEQKFSYKYTQLDSGSTPMGGWSNAGIKKFDTLCKAIKAERAKPKYQAAEQAILPAIRQLDRVEANTEEEFYSNNRRVLPTAVPLPEEIEFEEEV